MTVLTASIRQFGVHFFERVLLLPSSRIYVVTGMSSSHASTFSTNFSCQFFSVAFKKCTQGSCVVTLPLSTPPNPLDSCYDRPSTDTRQWPASVQRASLSWVKQSALALSACFPHKEPVLNVQISRPIELTPRTIASIGKLQWHLTAFFISAHREPPLEVKGWH